MVANHQTYFDPFWICIKINRTLRFIAWDKAFDWFLIGWMIRKLGAFPVSLERGGTLGASKRALKVLRQGATLVIFPEASREFSDGEFLEFKTGAVRLAIEARVPILPVTVCGGNHVWAQDMKFPKLHKVKIIYHPLFKTPEPAKDIHAQVLAVTSEIKEIIKAGVNKAKDF